MISRIGRFWRTIKYLKPIQVRYQLYYRWRRLFNKQWELTAAPVKSTVHHSLSYTKWIPAAKSYDNGTFFFLNQSKKFEEGIDWNFQGFGKLWAYNLNYFDFLLQPKMDKKTGLHLINDFLQNINSNTIGLDPYPISLRTINWVKFCLKFDIQEEAIHKALYGQLVLLMQNIEYHLMGNHLLENGCSLLIGGLYFEDQNFLNQGKKILNAQLNEQILDDGGHFERSPMYHQILLSRLLDCFNLAQNFSPIDGSFTPLLKNKAESMLGWLANITFKNGAMPRVNDSANGIAPSAKEINAYAQRLGVEKRVTDLKESGYRKIEAQNFEWFIDVGDIGPDYIPGHAHSDTFSFILHVNSKPFIVDTGISTYEESERRVQERSTSAHNTIMMNGTEQTEVWQSFRVGRRAHIINLREKKNSISAGHDGYQHLGLTHRRTFKWSEKELIIKDVIKGGKSLPCIAYFHFHPQVDVEEKGQMIIADGNKLSFKGHDAWEIKPYQFATGFNRLKQAKVLEVNFENSLETRIKL